MNGDKKLLCDAPMPEYRVITDKTKTEKCISNCKKCVDSKDKCETCNLYYRLFDATKCEKCEKDKCLVC